MPEMNADSERLRDNTEVCMFQVWPDAHTTSGSVPKQLCISEFVTCTVTLPPNTTGSAIRPLFAGVAIDSSDLHTFPHSCFFWYSSHISWFPLVWNASGVYAQGLSAVFTCQLNPLKTTRYCKSWHSCNDWEISHMVCFQCDWSLNVLAEIRSCSSWVKSVPTLSRK